MGRYIAGGIATGILIEGKHGYNLRERKEEIMKQLNRRLNMSVYNIEENDCEICLYLKKEYIENNIHELVKEVATVMNVSDYFLYHLDVKKVEDFTLEKCPVKVTEKNNPYNKSMEYLINDKIGEQWACFQNFSYILLDEILWDRNLEISIRFIPIFIDFSKISIENHTVLLQLLNIFSKAYFKSNLSNNFLFYIDG